MKLIEHILKEHRTVHIYKDKKRFVLRILPREHHIVKARGGCCKAFYMDVWKTFYLKRSRRYIVSGEVYDLRKEFDTLEEALNFIKSEGFTIKHPRKLPKFFLGV